MKKTLQHISRREFLRLASLMGGASLFAGCHLLGDSSAVPKYIQGAPGIDPLENLLGIKNIYSVCALCPGNCGIRCRVAESTVVKIDGSPFHPATSSHPFSFETPLDDALKRSGSICAMGGAGIQTLYDPFRVIKPLKRVGPRGSNKWMSVSWDQAVSEIVNGGNLFGEGTVKGLKDIARSPGSFQFLLGRTDWASSIFVKKWLSAFPGSVLLRDTDVQIAERARMAADTVFGDGTGRVDTDYTSARCVISFGDAPLDSGEPLVAVARQIADARSKPVSFSWAVVDPRLSTSAAKADLWVPLLPGKDRELALGVMRAFLDHHGDKIRVPREVLETTVGDTPSTQYAEACGVVPEMVHRIADFIAEGGARSAVIPGRSIYAQIDGLDTAKIILMLNAMVGSLPDQGGLVKTTSPFFAAAEKRLFGEQRPEIKEVSSTSWAGALMVWQTNPVYDDPARMVPFFSDKSKIGLTVVIDRDMTETAAYADYILPETTYLERWDICGSPPVVKNPGFGVRVPVVGGTDPRNGDYYPIFPETKIAEDILALIGGAAGVPMFQPDKSGQRRNAHQYFTNALGAVCEVFQAEGLAEANRSLEYSRIIERGGIFINFKPSESKSVTLQVSPAPVIPKPDQTSSQTTADELVLISYTLPFNRSSRSVVNSWLLEVLPINRVLMNPRDAERRYIQQGDKVRVLGASIRFEGECIVHIVPGIRPGVAALARGFGHAQFGANSFVIDATANRADRTRGTGINPQGILSVPGPHKVKISKL